MNKAKVSFTVLEVMVFLSYALLFTMFTNNLLCGIVGATLILSFRYVYHTRLRKVLIKMITPYARKLYQYILKLQAEKNEATKV
jgi:hypothetical protein